MLDPHHCQYPPALNNNFPVVRQAAAPIQRKDMLFWPCFQCRRLLWPYRALFPLKNEPS